MIGKTISHYQILEEIGAGGMGIVYKAEDTKLKRIVALKFLPPELTRDKEAKKRFLHEARAASALDHPNICNIYEIDETSEGQMFISMAYYEGQTLKDKIASGPLPIAEAIDISIQIAEGLNKAHKKDIVHRDIKSANIMITDEGVIKILDFGLAKLRGVTKITKEGTTLGTVSYMSPEQATGEKVDQRSDIWSLGVLLYEMITGQLPFKGEYEQAIMYAIMNEEPEPVTGLRTGIPLELERIIKKILAKDPARRFQSCADLTVDLKKPNRELKGIPISKKEDIKTKPGLSVKRIITLGLVLAVLVTAFFIGKNFLSTKKPPEISSLAVLPLENLSGDPEQEYFSDGMTDELIANLGKIGSLRVISRQSVMRYKKTDKSMPQIARELDVHFLIEGTVLKSGERVRITVQLIEGKSDTHRWAESYTQNLEDVFELQSEVAKSVAREIKIRLTPEEKKKVELVRRVNPRAHELYLLGRYQWNRFNKDGWEKAAKFFQEAIKVDPQYAQAYAGLADAYAVLLYYECISRKEAFPKIKELLKRAFEIDDTLPEAHQSLAVIKFYQEWDWSGAEKEFKRALELNPNLVGNNEYAWFLAAMGRFDEAIREARRTLKLDPYTFFSNSTLAQMYYFARQYNQSLGQLQRMLELGLDNTRSQGFIAFLYARMGEFEKAVKTRQQSMTLSGASTEEILSLEKAFKNNGPRGYWKWRLQRVDNPDSKARLLIHLGEADQAIVLLEKMHEQHNARLFILNVHPDFDPLRSDPRFQKILRLMKFPKYKPVNIRNKKDKK